MNADAPKNETDIMQRGLTVLNRCLPEKWTIFQEQGSEIDRSVDALLRITAPDGTATNVAVEVKGVVQGRDVAVVATKLEGFLKYREINGAGLIIARYLPVPVRERLKEAGLSYVDATGNVRLTVASPGLFISDRGEDKDPWRGPGRPRGTLKGAPPANLVRTITDFTGPWTVRQLVDIAKTSTGATYRVVELLEREGLAVRNSSGQIEVPSWVELTRLWSRDYSFVGNSRVTRWIAPRGLDALVRVAAQSTSVKYAVTGTIAAAEWAPYAPARNAMVYVNNADDAAREWGLRPAEAGANVMLAEPEFDVVFERSLTNAEGLEVAAPSQVVADLMTGPGRSPAEAEELIEWMMRNEQSWRS